MCGIAGRFHPVSLTADPLWHHRVDGLLAHRGPDGKGHYHDVHCELVHRRLALIDLSPTGHQPMPNEDGSIYVVFNGEIYNHLELRAALEGKGHRFRGTSDTEVLVHLYEEYGAEMASHLRGMFAFAIYDRRARQVFLARDRYGIKPLYYAHHEGQILFASEIKALLALTGFRPVLDRQACYDYLGLGYVPEPWTGFANIHTLRKGTALAVGADGEREIRFHEIQARPDHSQTIPHATAAMAERLLHAVERQSLADVPVAALLSGGIDSSLVVAAYCRVAKTPPRTFNVRFPDREYDETLVAQAVSKQCGTQHKTIDLGEWSLGPDAIQRLLLHFDQPFADTSLIPTYAVCRAIREHGIICTLSGDGGDEAFGGYARFWRANRLIQMMKLPGWVQRAMIRTGSHLAEHHHDRGRQLAKAAALSLAGQEDAATLIGGLSNYLDEEQKAELVLPPAREGLVTVYRYFDGYAPAAATELEALSRRMTEKLFSVGLPSDMLRKVDMMSMLAGIEVRVPMLDEEVVALGLALPHRLKTDGRSGKLVLRSVAREWLPRDVAAHAKHGFSIPVDVMVTPEFHQMLEDHLLSASARVHAFLNIRLIREWVALFKQARTGHRVGTISRGGLYQRIFILLALELWLREHGLSW
jgi:asparagine synthase (glutamine-hydrolysing)